MALESDYQRLKEHVEKLLVRDEFDKYVREQEQMEYVPAREFEDLISMFKNT